MVPAPFIGGTASVIRSPTATSFACTGGARNPTQILESWICAYPARKTVPLRLDNCESCTARANLRLRPCLRQRPGPDSAAQVSCGSGRPHGPDQWWPRRDRKEQERPGLNEALAAVRAGGTLVLTKLHRLAPPHPMLENIIEVMTTSQVFRLPAGMTMTI